MREGLRVFLLATALAAPACAVHAAPLSVDIQPQNMESALKELGRQGGIQIVFLPGAVEGAVSGGVRGAFEADEALRRILSGSGLSFRKTGEGYIVVRLQAAAPDRAIGAIGAAETVPPPEIVVTGSRLIRNGFDAPTPVSIVSAQDFHAAGAKAFSEFVREIPAVAGAWDLQSRSRQNAEFTGMTAPALRGLGTNRTLVLLDGQRSVPSVPTGEVDTSNFPQMLVSRVDVVTGGASAAYGSDAVSGVMNYVIDKEFVGLKAEAAGGASDFGDDRHASGSFAVGAPFAGGKGHFLFSAEAYGTQGILGSRRGEPPKRAWQYNPDVRFENPSYAAGNGQPFYVIRPDLGDARAIKGALIYSGPLRGTAFGEGGTTFQYRFGQVVGNRMSGGDWRLSEMSGNSTLDPKQSREGVFTRLAYDMAGNVSVYAQASWNHTRSNSAFCCLVNYNIDVRPDNAFLPAPVAAQAAALGLTIIRLGSFLDDAKLQGKVDRRVNRYVLGAGGDFDAFGRAWDWNAYYQYGLSRTLARQVENVRISRFNEAIDAVVNPANGAVVCRSKLTNPAGACQPYNPFGWGVVSAAARAYVGISPDDGPYRNEKYDQHVAAASIRGEPLSLWAGPVSVAVGGEYRKESLDGVRDPISPTFDWMFANVAVTKGQFDVTEGFAEVLAPLARDLAWAKSLDFNGAVRGTNYSSSGFVTTWKAGLTWSPIDEVRFRATRSRDIRAPNISELYAAGTFVGGPLDDPFTGLIGVRGETVTTGNPGLKPEKADTLGVGVVLQPRFAPGLTASADYYDVEISNAIGTAAGGQQTIDQCFAGNREFCPNIERRADGTIGFVYVRPINFVTMRNRGVDLEVSYRLRLEDVTRSWRGDLAIRWMATHFIESLSDNGITPAVNRVGENAGALPNWRHRLSAAYSNESLTASVSARAISAGRIDNTWIECDSGCPASTIDNRTIQAGGNQLRGYFYIDTLLARKFEGWGSKNEIFFNVRNLLNQEPPKVAQLGNQGTRGNRGTIDTTYDMIGRAYRIGLRIRR